MKRLICLLLLLPLTYPYPVLAQSIPEPARLTVQSSSRIVYIPPSPLTVAAVWPTRAPRIAQVKRYPSKVTIIGNCVTTLKRAGLLPNKPVTKDGRAATIPIKPLAIKEGETAVIRTAEGSRGHVLQVKLEKGNYISTVEGGYRNGVGRVVPLAVIQGQVSLP